MSLYPAANYYPYARPLTRTLAGRSTLLPPYDPYYPGYVRPYYQDQQSYTSYANWSRQQNYQTGEPLNSKYSYYKPELYRNSRATPLLNLAPSSYNNGLYYPYDLSDRAYLGQSRASLRPPLRSNLNSRLYTDETDQLDNQLTRQFLRAKSRENSVKSTTKSGRKSILKNSSGEANEAAKKAVNKSTNGQVPPLDLKPTTPLPMHRKTGNTNNAEENDDDYFKRDDFNSNTSEILAGNNPPEEEDSDNFNSNNSDDNFIVTEDGRLTKMKQVPLKNPNIHEYLYSMSNNDNKRELCDLKYFPR
jgi:hypothetical protein